MSGYLRQGEPNSPKIIHFVGEREIATVMRSLDPFGVDDPCAFSPTARHYGIGSCGDVACCYCGRVFWK